MLLPPINRGRTKETQELFVSNRRSLTVLVRAILFLACVGAVNAQPAISQPLNISVNYKNYEKFVFKHDKNKLDLLCTFVVSARPRVGEAEERQLSSSGQARFDIMANEILEIAWKASENRGFVLWPYRDVGPLPPDYTKFRLKPFEDVFIETRDRTRELISRGHFKPAEEDSETLKQMFQVLPIPNDGIDRRAEFQTSLLRSLCNAALKYRDTHRIRNEMDDANALERADIEADWLWELVWDSAERAAQGDLEQLIETLLLWEAFARDTYVLDRHNWKAKKGKKIPAFRSEVHRRRLVPQIEAIQRVLNREAIAAMAEGQLQKIPSKKIRESKLKLWQAGALGGSAGDLAFENLSILIDALHRYCRAKG